MEEKTNNKSSGGKWRVIALCFLTVMISLGFGSYTKSLFPDEIAKALNVERSLVSIGESCRYIATAIVNVFFGTLVARFGAKKLICAGFTCLICSMLLYSFANALALIYIAGTLLGIGFSWTGTAMVGHVVGLWCTENKGTIMGLVLASNGLGGAIAIQCVGAFIDPNVIGSYRMAYRFIAAVFAVTLAVLIVFFRDKPNCADQKITKRAKKRGHDWEGIEFSDALRRPYFWGATVCIFLSGLILQGMFGIVSMHLKDVGIDYSRVKALLSFGSLILASAKFMTGFVYDRVGLRITASASVAIAVAASLILALTKAGSVGFALAIIYTVIIQFAMPLETVMLPIYAADLFGNRSYSKILGVFVSVNTAGYALGAPLMNLCHDILGSYVPALITAGCLMMGVLILLQLVISASQGERKRLAEQSE